MVLPTTAAFTAFFILSTPFGSLAGICDPRPYTIDGAKQCEQMCCDSCEAHVSNLDLTQPGVEDEIKTKLSLCWSLCNGNAYKPHETLRKLMGNEFKLPELSNFDHCLVYCKDPPISPYCLEGYLSSFIYCDCVTCCRQKVDPVEAQLCIVGCHDWFLRQWSPLRDQGCRSHPEEFNRRSTSIWCEEFCMWKYLRLRNDPSLNLTELVPQAASLSELSQCLRTCNSLIVSGISVDYDIDPNAVCADRSDCIESVTIYEIRVVTNITDAFLQTYRRPTKRLVDDQRGENPNPTNTITIPYDNDKILLWANGTVSWPRSLSLLERKINIHVVDTPAFTINLDSVSIPGTESFRRNIREVFFDAFRRRSRKGKCEASLSTPLQTSWGAVITSTLGNLTVGPCERATLQITCDFYKGLQLLYGVYLRVSDTKSFFPMSAVELRDAVEESKDWRRFYYVGDFDSHTIQITGGAYAWIDTCMGYATVAKGLGTVPGCVYTG